MHERLTCEKCRKLLKKHTRSNAIVHIKGRNPQRALHPSLCECRETNANFHVYKRTSHMQIDELNDRDAAFTHSLQSQCPYIFWLPSVVGTKGEHQEARCLPVDTRIRPLWGTWLALCLLQSAARNEGIVTTLIEHENRETSLSSSSPATSISFLPLQTF